MPQTDMAILRMSYFDHTARQSQDEGGMFLVVFVNLGTGQSACKSHSHR